MAFLYIVECKGTKQNTYYTGIAKDIGQRLREHCGGGPVAAKYTRAHPVVALAALWEIDGLALAAKGEYAVKRLTRKQKQALVNDKELLLILCPGLKGLPFTVRRDMTLADCLNQRK